MDFFKEKINGFKKRWLDLGYGIVYLRATNFSIPSSLWINGRFRKLRFISPASKEFLYEFNEICINDCYCLKALRRNLEKIHTIVDIGANQGIFLVAARRRFPKAAIDCYEPNIKLENPLKYNSRSLGVNCYFEAVTKEDCRVNLSFGPSDLHTTTHPSTHGDVRGTAFRTIIERAGGQVDILKMDCEGGEWDIFEDTASWKHVNSVTMEYHLWAKRESTRQHVKDCLRKLNFHIIADNRVSDQFGIITAIK